jgi:transposase
MNKGKKLDFTGETIYCGVDVHKTNFKVHARMNNMEVAAFSQDPDPELIKRHFDKNYPGAQLKLVYEAGFSGFGLQRSLNSLGVDCIVVNAADVPASDKDRKRKDDKRDARKLSLELAKGTLKGIYVPDAQIQNARALCRSRQRTVHDQTRTKNRIMHFLLCNGLDTSEPCSRWSMKFVKQLQELNCDSDTLRITLDFLIQQYLSIRRIIKEQTLAIKKLSQTEPFASVQKSIQSVDGVGVVTGMIIQTEIGDIDRFKILDSLCDFAGFVPDIHSTNDKKTTCGITSRANTFLRAAILESSWVLIRKDPAMFMKYNEYKKRMNSNKAIIRICKHLLSRIRHVWKTGTTYQRGIV